MNKNHWKVRRALDQDLVSINQLLNQYDLKPINSEYLKYDIALVAEDQDKIIGFVWCGVMANKTIGYIDHFTIDKAYAGFQVGVSLGKRLLGVCKVRGLKSVLGLIGHHQYHNASLANAKLSGFNSSPLPFTFVYKELV